MTHDIHNLVKRILQLKEEDVKKDQEEVLNEIYNLVDEYNMFVKSMDIKFDRVVLKLEGLVENGH